MRATALWLGLIIVTGLLARAGAQVASPPSSPAVLTRFASPEGLTLRQLAAGAPGEGVLLYYRADRSPERPSLVVEFTNTAGGSSLAEVYSAPEASDYVPVAIGERITVASGLVPRLVMEAPDGWWVRGEKINYDLDVLVRHDVYSMWGARLFDYPRLDISERSTTARIQIRDPQDNGRPQWDLRRLVPAFTGYGFTRASYAESKCESPLVIERGVTPEWPFVAPPETAPYGFLQQTPGILTPPIVVDWATSKVTAFAELVTVRSQNCSYAIYSLSPLVEGEVNSDVNFETPFAFYDLSGEGRGYPNLIIRTERFPAADPRSVGMDLYDALNSFRLTPRDVNNVRYSWRHAVGDGTWDYTLQLLGFHPYESVTPIAGGFASIKAPSHEEFPGWVIDSQWPVVNFVDTTGGRYASSEGTYEWNAKTIGLAYAFGWEVEPHLEHYGFIPVGMRGEYRYSGTWPTELYYSPIDNRLHLLGAEGGLWNLGGGLALHMANLAGGPHIDSWTLGPLAEGTGDEPSRARLVNLGDYQLTHEGSRLTLRRAEVEPALFTVAPPTDAESWRSASDLLARHEATARDPLALTSWLDAFGGQTLVLESVELGELWVTDEGFGFVLEVSQPTTPTGELLVPALRDLPVGRQLVTYDEAADTWAVEPATPPRVSARLEAPRLRALYPGELELTLTNAGNGELITDASLLVGDTTVERWSELRLPGEGAISERVRWIAPEAGEWDVTLLLGDEQLPLGTVEAGAALRTDGLDAFLLANLSGRASLAVLLGIAVLGLAALWRLWWASWS